MNKLTDAERRLHAIYLDGCTTQHLIEAYRKFPTVECQRELERRGVTFWHYALTKIAN